MTPDEADRMTLSHLPLARWYAWRFCRHYPGASRPDVYAASRLGVVRAVACFDATRGTKFSTLALWLMWGEARDTLRAVAPGLRVPFYPETIIDPSDSFVGVQRREEIAWAAVTVPKLMAILTPDEREVIRRAYGLGCDQQTNRAIGQALGISGEGARLIRHRALAILRAGGEVP